VGEGQGPAQRPWAKDKGWRRATDLRDLHNRALGVRGSADEGSTGLRNANDIRDLHAGALGVRGSADEGSHHEGTVALERFTIDRNGAALPQIAHKVPVHGGIVDSSGLGI